MTDVANVPRSVSERFITVFDCLVGTRKTKLRRFVCEPLNYWT